MNFKKYLLLFSILALSTESHSQVGIGTIEPSPAAMLEVSSQTNGTGDYKGFMPPRVPDVDARNSIPVTAADDGLMVYVQDIGCLQIWDGSGWENIMCQNYPPVAQNVSFSGNLFVGEELEATFTYFDAEGDPEGAHSYQWYRADDMPGAGAIEIPGATSETYQIVTADLGKYLAVEITPRAITGLSPGASVRSSYQGPVVVPLFASDLFISEYVEGSGQNKAIEIANFTGSAKNLNGYRLVIYSNGNTSPQSPISFNNNYLLAHGDVYIIKHSDASGISVFNQASGALGFNGDDAIVLRTLTGTNIDVVGIIGDTEMFGENKTLRKKPATGPSTTYDTNDYDSFSQDTFDGLGWHTF